MHLSVQQYKYSYTNGIVAQYQNIKVLMRTNGLFVIFPDDGLIQQSDLREVMKACMEENGMRFDDKEIEGLAQALYEDAAGLAAGEEPENCPGITVDDLKAELAKHDGLLENLSIK